MRFDVVLKTFADFFEREEIRYVLVGGLGVYAGDRLAGRAPGAVGSDESDVDEKPARARLDRCDGCTTSSIRARR